MTRILEKVLPKPLGRGRGARYDDRHLLRARVIKQLRSADPSLDKIRAQLAPLTEDQLRALLPKVRPLTADGVPQPPPAPSYPFLTWETIALMPGLLLILIGAFRVRARARARVRLRESSRGSTRVSEAL